MSTVDDGVNQLKVYYPAFMVFLQRTLVYFFCQLSSVECRKYANSSSPHVVALTPQVLRLV